MRIDTLLGTGDPTISFEFFPPKDDAGVEALFGTIDALRPLSPSFISITRTGAGTGQTLDLTLRIQRDLGIRTMSHLTCVHHTRPEMAEHLDTLWDGGVRNVLALRGDLESGQTLFKAPKNGFAYANANADSDRDNHLRRRARDLLLRENPVGLRLRKGDPILRAQARRR